MGVIDYEWNAARGGFVRSSDGTVGLVIPPTNPTFTWDWSLNSAGSDYLFTPKNTSTQSTRVEVNAGDDILEGGLGNDFIAGQAGDDIVDGGDGDDILYGDDAIALAWGIEGNDEITAGTGKDTLYGGGGDDALYAVEEDGAIDTLYGGEGDDLLAGGSGHDQLFGQAGDDELTAGSDGSTLDGGDGNDVLVAGLGNDVLKAGAGNDTYVTGQGNDSFTDTGGYDRYEIDDATFKVAGTTLIADSEGSGAVILGGSLLNEIGWTATSGSSWVSDGGDYALTLSDGGLTITQPNAPGHVVIQGFSNTGDYLGIKLPAYANTNHAPIVDQALPDASGRAGAALTLAVPSNTFRDADGDALTYTAQLENGAPLPDWLTFNPSTATFHGTPTSGSVGSYNIVVTATDGQASASDVFALRIDPLSANHAPVVNVPIADQTLPIGTPFAWPPPTNTFADPDGDALTYSATLGNGNALPSWVQFNPANGVFSGTATTTGVFDIQITASDGKTSTSDHFNLTVQAPTNHAPVVNVPIADQTLPIGTPFAWAPPGNTFADPDGDALTYSATLGDGSALPSWVQFNPANGVFSGTATTAGVFDIQVTASDGKTSVSDNFNLTVGAKTGLLLSAQSPSDIRISSVDADLERLVSAMAAFAPSASVSTEASMWEEGMRRAMPIALAASTSV